MQNSHLVSFCSSKGLTIFSNAIFIPSLHFIFSQLYKTHTPDRLRNKRQSPWDLHNRLSNIHKYTGTVRNQSRNNQSRSPLSIEGLKSYEYSLEPPLNNARRPSNRLGPCRTPSQDTPLRLFALRPGAVPTNSSFRIFSSSFPGPRD